ncbi:MAG: hypothetical protein ACRDJC_25135 [Thermomicrobiales bacterium]
MNGSRREQYGWVILVVVALVPLMFGVKGLITGAPGNPAVVGELTGLEWEQLRTEQPGVGRLVTLLARHEAIALLGWGFWLAWTSIHGYRSGERWVWYGWWTVPLLIISFKLTGEGAGEALGLILLGVAALSIVGLILSRRESCAVPDTAAGPSV